MQSLLYGNLYQQQPMGDTPLPPLRANNEGGFDVQ